MKLGFLYAGQGSQHPGMGADLYERFPTFRAVLGSAAEQVDFDLKEVSFTDTKGILNQTRYTQPCMVAFAAGMTALLAPDCLWASIPPSTPPGSLTPTPPWSWWPSVAKPWRKPQPDGPLPW